MNDLVKKFCTPPYREITGFDLKLIASSEKSLIDFEEMQIPVYSWGKGEKILLVHGWGSRASHMSLLAQMIANYGFNVFAFDAPAHSSEKSTPLKATSNMFEFGRSISAVAKHIGKLHAVIAHSLGAITTIFTLEGFKNFKENKFNAGKIVLINSPSDVESIISWFSKKNNLTEIEKNKLRFGLEQEFDFSISDYCISLFIKKSSTDIMIIHDEDDTDVMISNAYNFKKVLPDSAFYFTKGLGHAKILFDRETIKTIIKFITI